MDVLNCSNISSFIQTAKNINLYFVFPEKLQLQSTDLKQFIHSRLGRLQMIVKAKHGIFINLNATRLPINVAFENLR